jgi:hypothetical protein
MNLRLSLGDKTLSQVLQIATSIKSPLQSFDAKFGDEKTTAEHTSNQAFLQRETEAMAAKLSRNLTRINTLLSLSNITLLGSFSQCKLRKSY